MISSTILHYNILEKLGEGGMGKVYKAQDTKLDRFVALKFLPSKLTTDEEQKARFIQEAKTASAMNHPNICTIYSIEEYDNDKGEKQLFIAMEYVEGESLKDKKDKLSEKQKLEISIQVAEGLAAAHEKGIIHRDIKPENIMIRKDGIAQIMDFGLAKLYADKNVSRLTKVGTTVGTLGYMSPEQVQGLDVDHRTDIFSFGVVLYEMFAGTSPFNGMHETAIMYEIVNVESPPISTIKPEIDPELDEIILECLEKDKDERRQSAKELAKDLRKIKKSTGHRKSRVYSVSSQTTKALSGSQAIRESSGSVAIEVFNKRIELGRIFSSGYLSWGIALILLVVVLYLTVFNKQVKQIPISSTSAILPPDYNFIWTHSSLISHNGKNVVFAAMDTAGDINFWLRPTNSSSPKVLTKLNTLNQGFFPFWSSDDKYLFYFLDGILKKVDINSGAVIDICKAPSGRGGTENKNGDIVFAPHPTSGLYIVSSNGGTPREIIKTNPANSQESLRYPYFLPDGKHFLYTIMAKFSGASEGDMIMVGSIDSEIKDTVLRVSSNAEYANGYLFFVRQATLMCQAFDPDNFKLSGNPHTISENIDFDNSLIQGTFSVSDAGNLIIQKKGGNPQIVLTDDKGNIKEKLFAKKIYLDWARISPGGDNIVYSTLGSDNKNYDIWSYDYKRKTSTRITLNANVDELPIWSANGKYIAFTSNRENNWDIFIKKADGTGKDSLIAKASNFEAPTGWSADGRYILSFANFQKTQMDIEIFDLKDHTSRFLLQTEFSEWQATFSDNMKWIMYTSNESGKFQVYIQPFDRVGGRLQLTTSGGWPVRWIDNDKAIIYQWQGDVFKVNVDASGRNFVVGKSEKLFNMKDKNIKNIYDVTKDGKIFLGAVLNDKALPPALIYIQNWKELINTGNK